MSAATDPRAVISSLEPVLHVSSKWLEHWVAVSSEILEFGRSRLDRNFEISKAIARSGSMDEAMDLHADYTRSALRDYFSEAGKLADLGTRAMLESLQTWRPAAREAEQQARPEA
ncbi:MAG TPA: phasin family protein [Stellaceae bacterium]|nr:phasin family protein [Stellaceae bacterium]